MSSSSQTSFLPLKLSFKSTNNYSNQSYNELISFGSIRRQLARQIPSYLNYINKKYPLTKIYPLNFEEFQKIKEEMLSIKKSINLLKKEKQKKLDEIAQLRCLMHQVRNGKYEFSNCENNKDININNNCQQEIFMEKNKNPYFRRNNKKPNNDNIKSSSEESERKLSFIHSTSNNSSEKDEADSNDGYEVENQKELIIYENQNCCHSKNDDNNDKDDSKGSFDYKENTEKKIREIRKKD